ncbi:MAG: ABC transporter permease [Sphingobacteriales bacterium]|nr:ABC transporter permease [Sphingobacteriales bacterium]
MKERDRIWKLVAKKLAGEATERDLRELRQLIKDQPESSYSIQLLIDMWESSSRGDTGEVEGAFDKHLQRLAAHQRSLGKASRYKPPRDGRKWSLSSGISMVENYGKTIRRNFLRSKTFSFINITGLAVGMASALLILLWIRHEMSYDLFHEKKDRIYMTWNRAIINGKIASWPITPIPMGPALKKDYPQVEEAVRTNWVGAFVLSNGDKHLETQGLITDPNFFNVFSFPLVEGDARTALLEPHSIVLTETMARKLFGGTNVLGRTMRVDSTADFTVTGVARDLPKNTQFRWEYLVPWSYMKDVHWDNSDWANNSIMTYVLLRPGVGEQQADRLFKHVITAHAPDVKNDIFLHPLRKWRLYSGFENGRNTGGEIEVIRMFGIIAGFILLIACINYMNLSTARSEKRAREVSIRKVVGAGKGSLVARFIGESVMMAIVAAGIALLIVYPALPYFNRLVEQHLTIPYGDKNFWLDLAGFVLLTGLLAGSYPAFYLSGFKPIQVLKGNRVERRLRTRRSEGSELRRSSLSVSALVTPRKVLVVVQFTTAIAFIICTLVVYQQLQYVQNRDAGFDKKDLSFVYIKGDIARNYPMIRNELLSQGLISSITRTNSPVTDIWYRDDSYEWKGKNPKVRNIFARYVTDKDFAKTIGLKMLEGRDIDVQSYPTDTGALVLNEAAVRQMGLVHPVGQTVKNNEGSWHIVGVVRDFVPGSPSSVVPPVVIEGPRNWLGTMTFRLKNDRAEDLEKISSIFKKYNPNYPFQYNTVSKSYALGFEGEQHLGVMAAFFAGLSIFISCLGLFALAAYMAENRVKEIGIRKVLGASVPTLTTLLTREFMTLVSISFVIASPLAGWAMHSWLQGYDYHTSISPLIFVVTGGVSFVIAMGTVSYQSLQAALASPAKSLRVE